MTQEVSLVLMWLTVNCMRQHAGGLVCTDVTDGQLHEAGRLVSTDVTDGQLHEAGRRRSR